VREVLVDDDNKQATVVVPDDQLSLAIGREGQNARLAARLTGWRIDIRSETDFAAEEQDGGYEEQGEASGRCAAILTSGRRCPNAPLPGSKFCGLPAHQELEGTGSVYVGGEPPPEILDDDGEVMDSVAVAAIEDVEGAGSVAAAAPGPDGADAAAAAPVDDDEQTLAGESSLGDESGPGDETDEDLEPQPEAAEPVGEADDEPAEEEAAS
jgi:N utilization substance protein A